MYSLRQIFAGNPRMGPALVGSILVHLTLLYVVSFQPNMGQTRRVSPSDFHDPLRARIVAESRVEEREEPAAPSQLPETAPAPELRPGTIISEPGPGLEKPAEPVRPQEMPALPERTTGSGEPGPPFGVGVRETLFVHPYPRRFVEANPLLRGQGYVRDVDLEERPRPVTLVIPEYPPSVLARNLAGWVTIAFFLNEQGEVVHAWPVEASEEFRPFEFDLIEALRQSAFTPGKFQGRAVKSITFQTLRFNPRGWPGQRLPESPEQAIPETPN